MPRRRPQRLTDLELEVMKVVWSAHPEPMTVREVVERMPRRSKALAYTTIQTMMTILVRKGALRSKPGPGRAHQYRALVSREDATSSMTRDLVDRLFGGSARPMLTHLLEHESLDREALEQLKARIESQLDDERSGSTGDGSEA